MHPRRYIPWMGQQWREAGRIHRHRVLLLLGVQAPVVVVGGGLLHLLHGLSWLGATLACGWVVPVCLLIGARERSIRRTVADCRGAVCWQCWYPLDRVEGHRCPECGSPAELPELQDKWRRVVWPGETFVRRALLVLIGGGGVVVALWLLAAVFLGLGPNLGLPFGYYGKLNRVVSRLGSLPGVKVVDVRANYDVHLEEFLVDLSVDGVARAPIEFPDADAGVLLRIVDEWAAPELAARP